MGKKWKQWQIFIFLASKITTYGDCRHEIKRRLLLERKAMRNPNSVLKSRDITLLKKVCRVKAVVFPVVMYGCESWTIKKAEWVKVTQSCPTLCDPMDCSQPGSSVHGILQARILEWVASLFSRGSSQPRDRTQVCHIAGRFFTIWATREAQRRLSAKQLVFQIVVLEKTLESPLDCKEIQPVKPKGNQP